MPMVTNKTPAVTLAIKKKGSIGLVLISNIYLFLYSFSFIYLFKRTVNLTNFVTRYQKYVSFLTYHTHAEIALISGV